MMSRKTIVYRVAFIGLGPISQNFVRMLEGLNDIWRREHGFELSVVAVFKTGAPYLVEADGLDLNLINQFLVKENIDWFESSSEFPSLNTRWLPGVDLVVAELNGGSNSCEFNTKSFSDFMSQGVPLIALSPDLIRLYCDYIDSHASESKDEFTCQGALGGSTISSAIATSSAYPSQVAAFDGALDPLANFVLTCMEGGVDFAGSISMARELGYTSERPSQQDSFLTSSNNARILSRALFRRQGVVSHNSKETLSDLTPADIEAARRNGARWRLVTSAKHSDGPYVGIDVGLKLVAREDPLYHIVGAKSSIRILSRFSGVTTIAHSEASFFDYPFGLISDVIKFHSKIGRFTVN